MEEKKGIDEVRVKALAAIIMPVTHLDPSILVTHNTIHNDIQQVDPITTLNFNIALMVLKATYAILSFSVV